MTQADASTTPDEIDIGFVPRVRSDVTAVEVAGETVLLGSSGLSHVLNPMGSLVWQFLDGRTALADLVSDFADVFGTDADAVEAGIVDFARILGRTGLLEGVHEPHDADGTVSFDLTPPATIEVGEPIEPFTFPDLDGTPRSLVEWRGRQVLLVNWNPGCAFCIGAASTLGALQPGLADNGVDLVFVTDGDVEDNRRVLDEAGLDAPALVRGPELDPFAGFGTPAAYLLDGDGHVVRPMAYGAVEVPHLATELADAVDVTDNAGAPASEPASTAQYLPAPIAVCGPGGGGSPSSDEWAGTRAYRFGDVHVGIRFNTSETADALDRLLLDARVDDSLAPDNYSVALHQNGSGTRRLNLLVQGATQLVRSRSRARPLAALLNWLTAEVTRPDDSLSRFVVTVGVREGEALLLPYAVQARLKELQPKLAQLGIALADVPHAALDPLLDEVVVPEPAIRYDAAVLDDLDDGVRLGPELPYVRPGRYPLAGWYLDGGAGGSGRLSPALALASAHRFATWYGERPAFDPALASLFERIPAYSVWMDGNDLVEQLKRV